MKKIFLPVFCLVVFMGACGPAAEDRQNMHARAKVFQDSIANAIRAAMAEAEGPAPNVQFVDTAAARKAQQAAATQTSK
jgi:hypothetical protein